METNLYVPVGLFPQCCSSSLPRGLTRPLADGIIWYFREMWFSADSAERGQLAVAPSQHLSNGLEEIHSQIKQTRRKRLRERRRTRRTHTGRLEMSCPAVKEQGGRVVYVRRPRSAVWQQQDCPNGFGCNHTALMVLWPVKRRAGGGGVISFWGGGGNLLFKESHRDGKKRREREKTICT